MSDLEILKVIVDKIPELPNWEEKPFREVNSSFLPKNSYVQEERGVSTLWRGRKIVKLNLDSNQLITLPKEIGQLSKLNHLSLASNQLVKLPKEIGQLPKLEYLNLATNQLITLPKEIGQLSKLRYLNIDSNQLTTIPKEIGQLTDLRELYLSANQLKVLPKEIGRLINLIILGLSSNQLIALPKEIRTFNNLTNWSLSKNKLTGLPKEIGELMSLSSLYLVSNQLTTLPKEIKKLTSLNSLHLKGNQFNIPNKIYKKPPKEQIQYILNLQEQGKTPLNEGKMILLGEGAAGKTALVERLIDNTFSGKTEMTEGIHIRPWWIEDIRLNVWDFGGQEIMRTLHQFFMTPRTLYVLVVTHRTDKDDTLEDWLRLIETYGGNSPVLIVVSKCDIHPLNIDKNRLRDEYNNIIGFYNTSAKNNEGISELRQVIKEQLTSDTLKHIKDDVPKFWINVKNALIKQQQTHNYINLNEYYQLCVIHQINDNDQQLSLLRLLHDLGIAFNFGDFKENPKNTNILKPEWVTKGIYKIINSNQFFQANGQVKICYLPQVLSNILDNKGDLISYKGKEKVIIGLMEQFELCFQFKKDTYLVPDLLKATQPFLGNQFDEGLKLWYQYEFLPRSIMPQFTTKTHELAQQYWLHGCIIETKDKQNTALIQVNYRKHRASISVIGNPNTRRRFLTIIQQHFIVLNDRLEPKPKILIFHPGYPKQPISYQLLVEAEQDGDRFIRVENIGKVEVKPLLNSVKNISHNSRVYKKITKEPLENVDALKKMLLEGEILEVLAELKTKTSDEQPLFLMEIRLKELVNDRHTGLVGYKDFKRERLKVINDILEVIKFW